MHKRAPNLASLSNACATRRSRQRVTERESTVASSCILIAADSNVPPHVEDGTAMERLLSLPGGAVNCTVLSRISLRYGIEPAMSSLRSHIEERTRAAQRQMLDAHSDAKAAHETGWIHWCTALLRAHFPSLAPPWVPQAGSTETSPNGASQLAALANGLPPAVSSHPEAFIWAFEQWQRPLKDAAQRNGDADVHSVAPLTQLFTDTPLAQALLAPCFRDAQTLDITRLP